VRPDDAATELGSTELGSTELGASARRWISADPDPATRTELRALLDADAPELAERMAGMPRFGTAGLRAPVRAGPNGMNVAVVRRATWGLARWLAERGHTGARVVVGRDARHGSREFAEATAGVLAAAGFEVLALGAPLPTPVLAYAVRTTAAVAGVQITASHNPPSDNGYKVYLGTSSPDDLGVGAQIVAPIDTEIEASITASPPASEIAVTPVDPTDPTALLTGYLDRVAAQAATSRRADRGGLRIAVTALHGVGNDVVVRALRLAGFTDVHTVVEQSDPDPDFPTVGFPNPEEPGACDLLLALAAEVKADIAIALDPDADRCAVGVPGESGWRMLSGNETGALLGEHLMARRASDDPLVATTLVSSRLLSALAAERGARYAETPTGFKWIVRAGPGLVFGYEEALGYCVDPDAVRDKDGISAATVVADLAATRLAAGSSLAGMLDEQAVRHGVHHTVAVTVRVDARRRAELLDRLAQRLDQQVPDVFVLRGPGTRAVIRPSGTEPKLKAYLEAVVPVENAAALPEAKQRAAELVANLTGEVRELLAAR
jgi:phosphomannomutase